MIFSSSVNSPQHSAEPTLFRDESSLGLLAGPILSAWQRIYRWTPEFRGKARVLRQWPGRLMRRWPANATITSRESCVFSNCDLNDFLYQVLFFSGYHEPDVDWMCARLLKRGDVFVDIGACYGYHSITNANRVGPEGRVIAFEPQPDAFAALEENRRLNGGANICIENVALSDRIENLQLHRYSKLGIGHTSIGVLHDHDVSAVVPCNAVTLDEYLTQRGVPRVALVKLDVEGAELKVIRGATQLLESSDPPMWILETNANTTAACGYQPSDLLALMSNFGYHIYNVIWRRFSRRVWRLEPFQEEKEGNQNVLCAIPSVHGGALARVGITDTDMARADSVA